MAKDDYLYQRYKAEVEFTNYMNMSTEEQKKYDFEKKKREFISKINKVKQVHLDIYEEHVFKTLKNLYEKNDKTKEFSDLNELKKLIGNGSFDEYDRVYNEISEYFEEINKEVKEKQEISDVPGNITPSLAKTILSKLEKYFEYLGRKPEDKLKYIQKIEQYGPLIKYKQPIEDIVNQMNNKILSYQISKIRDEFNAININNYSEVEDEFRLPTEISITKGQIQKSGGKTSVKQITLYTVPINKIPFFTEGSESLSRKSEVATTYLNSIVKLHMTAFNSLVLKNLKIFNSDFSFKAMHCSNYQYIENLLNDHSYKKFAKKIISEYKNLSLILERLNSQKIFNFDKNHKSCDRANLLEQEVLETVNKYFKYDTNAIDINAKIGYKDCTLNIVKNLIIDILSFKMNMLASRDELKNNTSIDDKIDGKNILQFIDEINLGYKKLALQAKILKDIKKKCELSGIKNDLDRQIEDSTKIIEPSEFDIPKGTGNELKFYVCRILKLISDRQNEIMEANFEKIAATEALISSDNALPNELAIESTKEETKREKAEKIDEELDNTFNPRDNSAVVANQKEGEEVSLSYNPDKKGNIGNISENSIIMELFKIIREIREEVAQNREEMAQNREEMAQNREEMARNREEMDDLKNKVNMLISIVSTKSEDTDEITDLLDGGQNENKLDSVENLGEQVEDETLT